MKSQEELKQLRESSVEDLQKKVASSEHELMNLRFRHASGQLKHTAQLKAVRRTISRAKTVLKQKQTASA